MRLTKRMRAIVDMCTPLESYADIGCDHGMISAALLEEGRAKSVLATDISEGSLAKARLLFDGLGVTEGISFALGDGLEPLSGRGIKGAVICGMGGELMTKILAADGETFAAFEVLVLSPNKYPERLRAFLLGQGFRLDAERTVEERGRFYTVIRAVPGEEKEYAEEELLLGRHTVQDADLLSFIESRIKQLSRISGSGAAEAERLTGLFEAARESVIFAMDDKA